MIFSGIRTEIVRSSYRDIRCRAVGERHPRLPLVLAEESQRHAELPLTVSPVLPPEERVHLS